MTMNQRGIVKRPCLGVFDFKEIIGQFPDHAETMLRDIYLTNEHEASARIFRVYHPVPAHYHVSCDEYLTVLSGRGRFFLADMKPFEVGPGQLLFFKKKTVHGIPEILEEPFVVLSVDTPRRDPRDVVFVNKDDGTPDTFIAGI
jgi:mannose-6-phosphate isomerase-like protein (cupin superfamily)